MAIKKLEVRPFEHLQDDELCNLMESVQQRLMTHDYIKFPKLGEYLGHRFDLLDAEYNYRIAKTLFRYVG